MLNLYCSFDNSSSKTSRSIPPSRTSYLHRLICIMTAWNYHRNLVSLTLLRLPDPKISSSQQTPYGEWDYYPRAYVYIDRSSQQLYGHNQVRSRSRSQTSFIRVEVLPQGFIELDRLRLRTWWCSYDYREFRSMYAQAKRVSSLLK